LSLCFPHTAAASDSQRGLSCRTLPVVTTSIVAEQETRLQNIWAHPEYEPLVQQKNATPRAVIDSFQTPATSRALFSQSASQILSCPICFWATSGRISCAALLARIRRAASGQWQKLSFGSGSIETSFSNPKPVLHLLYLFLLLRTLFIGLIQ
jgi:hypothetical protein